jgi:hypothetical protein
MSSPVPPGTREGLAVLLGAALLTVALTWPIAPRLATAGRIDSGDGRYSIWNVAWVAHALTTDPRILFDANIFHPHPRALAFSESNLVAGLLAVPVWVSTRNAIAASNWATLCAFFLAALSAFALVRHLTRSPTAAAIAATLFAFSPYAFARIPHIQLLMTFGTPLALLALHRFVASPTALRGVCLGLALAVQALACGYYGIFAGLTVAFGFVWFGVALGLWRRPSFWENGVLAAAVAAAIVWPFLSPYLAIQSAGFERSLDDARLFSVRWRSYFASPTIMHQWILPLIGTWRDVLFPGFVAIGLSTAAVVGACRAGAARTLPVRPHVVGFYVAIGVLAVWASWGPDAGLYRALYHTLPFFTLLRAPARFGMLVLLAAAVLSGIALADFERRLSKGRWRALMLVVIAATFARSTVGPLHLVDRPPAHAAYRQLAVLPWGPVVEFPYFNSADDRHRHTEYMLASTWHWKPLLNGYSDYVPEEAERDMHALETFPSEAAWAVLMKRRARYVLMHWHLYAEGDNPRPLIREQVRREHLRPVVDRDDISLYEIVAWPRGSDPDLWKTPAD